MTVRLGDVISYLDTTLEIAKFRDYCPNGLQVEGSPEVDKIVTAVSATAEVFERAIALEADLIIVHHGLIWGGGIGRVTGTTASRLRTLLSRSVSLAAYHLPLDAHLRLGNNVGLADAIGLQGTRQAFGDTRGHALGLLGLWSAAVPREEAIGRIAAGVGRDSLPFVFPYGPENVKTVGLCTGAASDLIEDAAGEGCDLYLTGELSERAASLARELQITLVAAGHYATEVFGVQRLGDELRMKFAGLQVEFVDVPTPI